MKDWKSIVKKLFLLPVGVIFVLVIISTILLVTVFVKGWENSLIAYLTYVLAFYTLTVLCVACALTFPGYYRSIRHKIYSTKFGNRYMTDVAFKTHVSLYRSLAVNLLYVAVNLFWGIWYHTAWFIIFAIYYSILAVMRFLLLRYVNRNKIGQKRFEELKRSRLCAVILLLINLILSGAVLMILYQNRGFNYHGMLIYVMALYTFYVTTAAIVNLIKYRKYNSPIMSTAKIINLAAALVSMLALETAMFAQFGADMSLESQRIMIIATGAGVSAVVVSMAVYTIVRANKELKNGIVK
ncbi:MAG: hypothetical protein IJ379_00275 [Lachnospiraceae bacterium]|nr:hypothetical protein [Lachnospiraceae bacterium]